MACHFQSGLSDSPLHAAVKLGSLEKVREILDQPNVDVNYLNSKCETPLHLACTLGHTDIIKLLIAFGANVFIKDANNEDIFERGGPWICSNLLNKLLYDPYSFWIQDPMSTDFNTPLHETAKFGHVEKVQTILNEQTVDINSINSSYETPLHLACAFGHKSCVHTLASRGADIYSRDCYNNAPIHRAASMGHICIIDMLITEFKCDSMIKGYQRRSLLHFASSIGNIELVETLINRHGLDPVTDLDACGCTPLHTASLCGQTSILDLLITKYNCPVDIGSEGQETPLHMACYNGHLDAIETLVVKYCANLCIRNWQSDPPVHLAAIGGHTNAVKALVNKFGCSLSDAGCEGRLLLHHACEMGHNELAEVLINDFNQHPMCVDDDEYTPLHYAALGGHHSVVSMLVSQHNVDLNARNNQMTYHSI